MESHSNSTGADELEDEPDRKRTRIEIPRYYRAMNRDASDSSARDHRGHFPSDLCDYYVWKDYQRLPNPEFLCHVPPPAVPPLPVTLLYEPFSAFTLDLLQDTRVDAKDIEFAQQFWNSLHDPTYITNHKIAVEHIQFGLITPYLGQLVTPHRSMLGVVADGMLMLNKGTVLSFEFKAQSGNAGDPFFENLDFVRRAGKIYPEIQTDCLAINIEGRIMHVVAASLQSDDKVWAEPLAVTTCYGGFEWLKRTAQIWRAIRLFVERARAIGSLPRSKGAPIPWPLRCFSNVVRLHDNKLVFKYVNSDGDVELAKFASSYSEEAHRAWQEKAPELKGGKRVCAEWWMVRMEYLSPEEGWVSAADLLERVGEDERHVAKLRSCILAAGDRGHSRGFVHADLRSCNVMVRASEDVQGEDGLPGYEVRIKDFEWAGKEGVAVYPRPMDPDVHWPRAYYKGRV